jgi:uroporphyrinogen-III synthase
MQIDLKGKKVLVTRPLKQADNLCDLIEASNGQAIRFPTIEILPPDNSESVHQKLGELSNFDMGIFISRNAVLKTIQHPAFNMIQLQGLTLFAIGAGTAEQLSEFGIVHVAYVEGKSSSEELLEKEELQTKCVANKNIIIFRGRGGREYLAETLKSRGAKVDYIEVYIRNCPNYDRSVLEQIWLDGGPDIIVVTSSEALQNLFHMLSSEQRELLIHKQLITIGTRIADLASKLGFIKKTLVAECASDKGILNVMK